MQLIASHRPALRKVPFAAPLLWILTLVVGLMPWMFATLAGAAAPYANVVVFDDGTYVDTSGTTSAESDNVQATLAFLGHNVTTTTGTSNGNFTSALNGRDVLLIPELEVAALSPLTAATVSTLSGFVAGGKGMVVLGTSTNRDVSFLNSVFGFSIADGTLQSTAATLNAASAAGTAFQSGAATLPANTQTAGLLTSSLPLGTRSIYTNGAETTIAIIPYGSGTITYLGWDWDNAKPAGAQDGGWITALDQAIHTTVSNTTPTISNIPDQAINEDATTGALAFTIGDAETTATSLVVSGSSSNAALVPDANIVFGGTGTNRTVTVTPLANAFGTATITISVSDGSASTSDTFLLTVNAVNDVPTISDIAGQVIGEDSSTGALAFMIGDVETAVASLVVSGSSSNAALVPDGNIVFGGTGTNRTVTVTPLANAFGTATITISVGDGVNTTTDTFLLTVNAVNDAPLADDGTLAVSEDISAGGTLSGSDIDSPSLTYSIVTNGAKGVAVITDASTGAYSYTPNAGANGGDSFTFSISDGTASSNVATIDVTIAPVNDAPTLDAIGNVMLNEDAGQQSVNLSGIGSGAAGEIQALTVTATSSNPALVPDPSLSYTSPNASGLLTFTPAADAFGAATITVVVSDDGGTNNGGVDSTTRTFMVTVAPVADTPSMTDAATNEDSQTSSGLVISRNAADGAEVSHFQITAITGGTLYQADGASAIGEGQFITAAEGAAGLKFTPAADSTANGSFKVQAATSATAAGLGGAVVEATVTVTPVNDAPTLDVLADLSVSESAPAQVVALSGISAGPADESGQSLSMTATSSNPALIPDPLVSYTSPDASGSLTFTPLAGMSGSATITVVVSDDGDGTAPNANTLTRTFMVFVGAVNNRPMLDTPANATLLEDAGQQSVNLSGISSGAVDENQVLSITATSSNPSLIPNPSVGYTSPNATATLTFTPAADAFGTATITVVVHDDGGTAGGGVDSYSTTFDITVLPVNDAPGFTVGPNQTVSVVAGPQVVAGWASGFVAGPANEAGQSVQAYEIVAVSQPGLFAVAPHISTTGTLTYTPEAGVSGTAMVSVIVRDSGGTANGGVNASSVQTFTITIVPAQTVYRIALPLVVR